MFSYRAITDEDTHLRRYTVVEVVYIVAAKISVLAMDGSCYEFNVSSRVAKNNFCLPLLIQINSKRRSEESFQNGENDRRTWCGRLSVRMLTMPLARNRLPTSPHGTWSSDRVVS